MALVVFVMLIILIIFMMLVILMMFMMLVMFIGLVMLVTLVTLIMLARLRMVQMRVAAHRSCIVYDDYPLRILRVDVVHISVTAPAYRLIEVVRLLVATPLAVAHHSAQLLVAVLPCLAVYVAIAVDGVEIAEVELQDAVALHVRESEFENHLVGYETCLSPYVGESLCAC